MASRIRALFKALFYSASVVYPALIFYFLVIQKTPLRLISLFVMAFALLAFIAGTSARTRNASQKKKKLNPFYFLPLSCLA